MVKQIYTSEEVYGKNASSPPDIILSLEEGVTASEWIRYPQNTKELFHTHPRSLPYMINNDTAGRSGDHAEHGIFYAIGDNLKRKYQIQSISVEVILRLIFSMMNLPTPPEITGKIPHELFHQKPSLSDINWDSYNKEKKPLTPTELHKIAELRKKK